MVAAVTVVAVATAVVAVTVVVAATNPRIVERDPGTRCRGPASALSQLPDQIANAVSGPACPARLLFCC